MQLHLDGAFTRRDSERAALTADIQLVTETEGITLRVEGITRFLDDKAYVRITKAPSTFPLLEKLKDQWLELPRGGQTGETAASQESDLFTSVVRLRREKLDDHSVTVYRAQATSQAIVRLLDGIASVLGTRLTAAQIDGIRQGVAADSTVPVEVWASPWTHELRRLSAVLKVPNTNTISFALTLTDRNKPVDIAQPEGATTLEGIVAGLQAQPSPSP